MPFRFLHTADLHLDLPIGGAGPTAPALTGQLATAAVDTLDRLVDLALDEDVDAVVVAGGLWAGNHLDAAIGRRVAEAFDRLAQAQVATIVTRHRGERLDRLFARHKLPDRVYLPDPGRCDALELSGRDGTPVLVAVASGREGLRDLCRRPRPPEGVLQIGLCPLPVRHAGDPDPPLAGTAADYWALGGRLPAQAAPLGAGGPWVVMPGPPQLHQPAEAATGCGVVLAELGGPDVRPAPQWRRVAAVELVTVALPLPPAGSPAALEDLLDQQAEQYATAVDDRPLLLRAVLHGTGPTRAWLADPAAEPALLAQLRQRAEQRSGSVWWTEVRLALVPGAAAQQLVTSDRRAAALVRAAGLARSAAPGDVLDAGSAGPRRWLPSGATWSALVTEGTSLGFDLLLRGDTNGREQAADAGRDRLAALEHRLLDVEQRLGDLGEEPDPPPTGTTTDGATDTDADADTGTDAESADDADDTEAPTTGRAELEALDEDIAATEAQLAAAQAEEARLAVELDSLSVQPGESPAPPVTDASTGIEQLRDALRGRRGAQVELEAATTTATVLRLGLERSIGDGSPWLRWVQPAALAVATVAVLVAVALLTSGASRAGIAVAVVALVSAAAALFLPTRPLRQPPDTARLRRRLQQADDDIRSWSDEVAAHADRAAAAAAALGLPADAGEEDLHRLEAETAGSHDREAATARARELQVARNTASAAGERVATLRRERTMRNARAAITAAPSLRAVLAQEHRGIADELSRGAWTLDRQAVAHWLLARAVTEPPETEPPDAQPDAQDVPPAAASASLSHRLSRNRP